MRTKRFPGCRIKVPRSTLILFPIVLLSLIAGIVHAQEPTETVRIESELVDLKVSVLGLESETPAPLLEQKDFQVLEDGVPQEVTLFEAADAPFDLVLLLDLSGSTADKLKMIRRSAKRFVAATRSIDRIAVVAFTDHVAVLSPFTLDRRRLKKDIDAIDEAYGGTNFWDSLNYVLREFVPLARGLRRTAVVVMTDGVDNALPGVDGPGSHTTFDELLGNVRDSEGIVFPVYLDTEKEDTKRHHIPRAAYAQARAQLAQLASACGSSFYRAGKLKDLDGVYKRVIRDLGTVYSIGYRPTNRLLDGKWRSVSVQLIGRPNLLARTKRGYYSKQSSEQQ